MCAELKKSGIIVSCVPITQAGLLTVMKDNLPEYEMSCHQSINEVSSLQLGRVSLVLGDLSCGNSCSKALCEQYYSLMTHYKETRWVFMVSQANYPLAVEYLLRPESTLLSDAEPIPQMINAIRYQGDQVNHISASLTATDAGLAQSSSMLKTSLSLSERQVLRLLAKGWGVNQIAMLLRKSNKTISAQKNSAMRRLMLRGNAELYAWLSSNQGMKELNLLPAWGEPIQWKNAPKIDTSLSLKTA